MEIVLVSLIFCVAFIVQGVLFYKLYVLRAVSEKTSSVGELMEALSPVKEEEEEVDPNIIELEQMTEKDL